ncbi:dynein intermediate chain IC78 [Monocercomonoides exilis]|uniref:dynein intermediate chain IC78 n=1 Tax=Monocercomonoides exilis TaxID=2049356 RepID=UPI00355A1049|nr:dynein intermediate chain IC78 [Monocercomonoides exilis]|eukprot:MONOS_6665.1-p1 / transcript=MONOS_6665.1 / gene=MONOS_6665 / organism=Monocercomonoides_exilis_PA203 / gene_product=dynein intermediate chain IC78 / transcript_product=dynein intermediate chain IC78 / location=Mono_scaffold00214:27585-30534(-) / protein_length=844 / sequence_SO=supercontig / SO=protein_coding / is_pseudo=false
MKRSGVKTTVGKKSQAKPVAGKSPAEGPYSPMKTPMTATGFGPSKFSQFEQKTIIEKPPNQLDLTDAELAEEIQLMLNTTDSFIPTNIVRYSNKDRAYKLDTSTTHTRTHFSLDSRCTYRDPLAYSGGDGEKGTSTSTASTSTSTAPRLLNAFNISAIGAQTTNFALKDRLVDTDPIEFQDFSFTVTQWEIFDSYMQDQERQKAERDQKSKRPGIGKKGAGGAGGASGIMGAATGSAPLIPIPRPIPMPSSAVAPSGGGVLTSDAATGVDAISGSSSAIASSSSTPSSQLGVTTIPTAASLAASSTGASGSGLPTNIAFETDPDVLRTLQVLERMTLQNTYDVISEDFKFWEDPSDPTKGDAGSLLPLWLFTPAKKEAKRKSTTCLAWHPKYPDFFAVGYGSFEFNKQGIGAVAVYTLKNHLNPEYFFTFDSGVMSIDWNPMHPPYMAVGLSNGIVLSFDIRSMSSTLSVSKIDFSRRKGEVKGKHTDSVWATLWEDSSLPFTADEDDEIMRGPPKKREEGDLDDMKKEKMHDDRDKDEKEKEKEKVKSTTATPGIMSGEEPSSSAGRSGVGQVLTVSGDGRVTRWRREKDRMMPRDVMLIKANDETLDAIAADGADEGDAASSSSSSSATSASMSVDSSIIFSQTVSGCTCLDIHPTRTHLILIGTEEGYIHKCTKSYSGECLQIYKAHKMPVYSVKWNAIHPRVFLSSGADWSVFLWDHSLPEPQLTFSLGASVGDVAWAPFSSTIFAACTSEGKVFVYDLNVNRQEPLCEQLVVKNVKLTKIAFSRFDPVLIVGDEKGNVHSFKLSPNLRRSFNEKPSHEEEIDHMERVLEYATRCKEAGM